MSYFEPHQLIEMFLAERDVFETSKRQYHFNLRRFFRWLKENTIDHYQVSRAHILQYKQSLIDENKTSLTIASYLGTLRMFYRWMNENKYYSDITTSLRITKEYKTFRKKSLNVIQAKRFMQTFDTNTIISKRDFAIANLMIRNGLREIEVIRMDVGDIIEYNNAAAICIQRKGRVEKNAVLPLSEKAMEAIEDYLYHRKGNWQDDDPLFVSFSNRGYNTRLSTQKVSRMIKTKLIQSGLNDPMVTAHSLRHTTATMLIAEGKSEYDVQKVMGHSSFQITQIYTRQKELDMMFDRNPIKTMDKVF